MTIKFTKVAIFIFTDFKSCVKENPMVTTTINFLPNKVYPALKRRSLEIGSSLGHDLSITHGATNKHNVPRAINGLGPCVGFTLFTPTVKFGAHSAPELDTNYNSISDFISKKIYELKKETRCEDDEISAVIYGGIANDLDNVQLSTASCNLVDAMEEGCKLESIEPTIISGQFGDGLNTRINSYVGDRQITMYGKLIDKIKLTLHSSQSEIQKVLEELFEYVKIPQNTKLQILENLPAKTEFLRK